MEAGGGRLSRADISTFGQHKCVSRKHKSIPRCYNGHNYVLKRPIVPLTPVPLAGVEPAATSFGTKHSSIELQRYVAPPARFELTIEGS